MATSLANDFGKRGIYAEVVKSDLGVANKAIVLRILFKKKAFYLKLYDHRNKPLALHEYNVLKSLDSYNLKGQLAVPKVSGISQALLNAVDDVVSLRENNYYYVIMSAIEGHCLDSYTKKEAVSILCDSSEKLLKRTLKPTVQSTRNILHYGQGIYTYISTNTSQVPCVDFVQHWQEYLMLVQAQTIFRKEDLLKAGQLFFSLGKIDNNVTSLCHNDLHIFNVLKNDSSLGIIDFAHSLRTTPALDYGGIIAHVGLEHRSFIIEKAKKLMANFSISIPYFEEQIDFFCLRRAIRRIVFLEYSKQDIVNPNDRNSIWYKPFSIVESLCFDKV